VEGTRGGLLHALIAERISLGLVFGIGERLLWDIMSCTTNTRDEYHE
jgi:hypothetical protein